MSESTRIWRLDVQVRRIVEDEGGAVVEYVDPQHPLAENVARINMGARPPWQIGERIRVTFEPVPGP
jgi:hypothetical protein